MGAEEGEEAEEEEGQEEEEKEEEEGRRALRHQDALRRPRRDLRQDQDVAPGDDEGALGVHQKNKLNKGRTIAPDAKLKKVLPANSLSMFKMPGMLEQHMSRTTAAWQNLMTFRRCRVCTIFDPWT